MGDGSQMLLPPSQPNQGQENTLLIMMFQPCQDAEGLISCVQRSGYWEALETSLVVFDGHLLKVF